MGRSGLRTHAQGRFAASRVRLGRTPGWGSGRATGRTVRRARRGHLRAWQPCPDHGGRRITPAPARLGPVPREHSEFLPHWRAIARRLKQRNALLKLASGSRSWMPWTPSWQRAGSRHALPAGLPAVAARRLPYWASCWLPEVGTTGVRSCRAGGATNCHWAMPCCCPVIANRVAASPRLARIAHAGASLRCTHGSNPCRAGKASSPRWQSCWPRRNCMPAAREWPVIALDDLASELDLTRQRRVLDSCCLRRPGLHNRYPDPGVGAQRRVPFQLVPRGHGLIRAQTGPCRAMSPGRYSHGLRYFTHP